MQTTPIYTPSHTTIHVSGTGRVVERNVASKRIKNAHRKYGRGRSLRAFARQCVSDSDAPKAVRAAAAEWLSGKCLAAEAEWLAGKDL